MKKNKNKKLKEKRSLPIIKVWKDIKNYRDWIRTIKQERANPNSKFNKFGLDHNYFYILYLPVTLGQENKDLPENIKRLKLVEFLTPVLQYLDSDLGFADYLIPEFNQFYDEEDNPTLTYGIIFRFAFKKLSLKWILYRLFFGGALLWAFLKWPIISSLWNLIV